MAECEICAQTPRMNDDNPYFKELIPTTENIARVLWGIFEEKIEESGRCSLYRIRLYETPDLYVDYWRERP